jgi:hypothetical protein
MIQRRGLLMGLLAAPLIVPAERLMRVQLWRPEPEAEVLLYEHDPFGRERLAERFQAKLRAAPPRLPPYGDALARVHFTADATVCKPFVMRRAEVVARLPEFGPKPLRIPIDHVNGRYFAGGHHSCLMMTDTRLNIDLAIGLDA